MSEQREQSTPPCPKCGAPMSKRQNSQTKDMFWGCSRFPTCKGNRNIVSRRRPYPIFDPRSDYEKGYSDHDYDDSDYDYGSFDHSLV